MTDKRARLTDDNAATVFTSLRGLVAPVDAPAEAPAPQAIEVELARLRPNPDQPRRGDSPGFSKESIKELADNIRRHGVLQPLLVRPSGRFYQIIAGERRFRACQQLGLERVPVRVVEPRDDQDELLISLAENLQRKNLGALEEAQSFRVLINRYGLSYRELSSLSGRSLAHVHGRLQLLQHDDLREAVEQKHVGVADAIQLARVPDEARRKELLAAVRDGSVRGGALRRQVQVFLGQLAPEAVGAEKGSPPPEPVPEPPPVGLEGALAALEALPAELSEQQRAQLRALAKRAAELLDLRLVSRAAKVEEPPEATSSRAPVPMSAESRRAISLTKAHRNARGYTVVNLIRGHWMNMERHGYSFSPGDWVATPEADNTSLVSFTYRVDGEPMTMQWRLYPDGRVETANPEARELME
jgi:ParB family chromosome partitioning protein